MFEVIMHQAGAQQVRIINTSGHAFIGCSNKTDRGLVLEIGMIAPRPLTGVLTHLQSVIPLLESKGHHIVLVTDDKYRNDLKGFDLLLTRSHGSRGNLSYYGFMPSFPSIIRGLEQRCDLFHIHGFTNFCADYLTIFRLIHRTPVIVTFHGSFNTYTCFENRFLKMWHNLAMLAFQNCVDRYVAVSDEEKKVVVDAGLRMDRVVVIYNGVDNKYITSEGPSRASLDKKTRLILFIGRISASKNLKILVRAVSHVVKDYGDVKLALVGPDWGEKRRLENVASRLGIGKSIVFMGKVSEETKMSILKDADLYVHPSIQDTWSISLLEASASGLPVVAFDLEANREMVVPGRTALLVEERSPMALADAILRVLKNDRLARQMGRNGSAFVAERYSWQNTVDELERLYSEVT